MGTAGQRHLHFGSAFFLFLQLSPLNILYLTLSWLLFKHEGVSHLHRVISSFVNPDQTGFISGRHSSSNIRRLLDILYSPSTDSPELVLSLDAEKAFDRVEYKFDLSPDFMDWIKLLYASPLASVSTNGIKSRLFFLHRGTR